MVENKKKIYELIKSRSDGYFQGLKINDSEKRKKELISRLPTAKQIMLSLHTKNNSTYQHLKWLIKKGFIFWIEKKEGKLQNKLTRYYLINQDKKLNE